MALTIQRGLQGGRGRYAYCAGQRETDRRRRQIDRGRIWPLHAERFTRVPRLPHEPRRRDRS